MAKSRARDSVKEGSWRGRVDRQAGSGLSVRAWCRRYGAKEASFHWGVGSWFGGMRSGSPRPGEIQSRRLWSEVTRGRGPRRSLRYT